MAKSTRGSKTVIVSCRVSPEEMQSLQELVKDSGISKSDLLRQGLSLLQENRQGTAKTRATGCAARRLKQAPKTPPAARLSASEK